MKKWLIIGGIILFLLLVGTLASEDTVGYYYDANNNGKEDWGELVWWEDSDGNEYFVD